MTFIMFLGSFHWGSGNRRCSVPYQNPLLLFGSNQGRKAVTKWKKLPYILSDACRTDYWRARLAYLKNNYIPSLKIFKRSYFHFYVCCRSETESRGIQFTKFELFKVRRFETRWNWRLYQVSVLESLSWWVWFFSLSKTSYGGHRRKNWMKKCMEFL